MRPTGRTRMKTIISTAGDSPQTSTQTAATAKQASCSHSAQRGLRSIRTAISSSNGLAHSMLRFHAVQ